MNGVKDDDDFGLGEGADENSNLSEKRKRLAELLSDTKEKSKQLNEIKKNYMDIINMKDEKIRQLKQQLGMINNNK